MYLSCCRCFKSEGGLTHHTKSFVKISKEKECSVSEDVTLMSGTEKNNV